LDVAVVVEAVDSVVVVDVEVAVDVVVVEVVVDVVVMVGAGNMIVDFSLLSCLTNDEASTKELPSPYFSYCDSTLIPFASSAATSWLLLVKSTRLDVFPITSATVTLIIFL
jgi:hypothetical protein